MMTERPKDVVDNLTYGVSIQKLCRRKKYNWIIEEYSINEALATKSWMYNRFKWLWEDTLANLHTRLKFSFRS
jgi:hypothetical protein